MTPRILTPVLALFASFNLLALSLDDIHYWFGEGSGKCAVVVDWGAKGASRAWGYKWNKSCTNLTEVVQRLVHEDPRLVSNEAQTFFGYDVKDVHPTWDKTAGTSGDPAAEAAANGAGGEWRFFGPFSSVPASVSVSAAVSPDAVFPSSGQWFVLRYMASAAEGLATPEPAESPYGYKVVDHLTYESNPMYNVPANVLGHPTMGIFSASSSSGISDTGSTINPAYPAWSGGRLLSLVGDEDEEEPGFVTIKFDHDVIDDPNNPFGIDLIVFGNAFGVRNSNKTVDLTTDPTTVKFSGAGAAEEALVEVSQDGETWYAYEYGPYADSYMPTLGYTYDTANPDPNLFSGNLYWGRAAQATRPVDPNCDFSSFAGLNLAQVCQRYNGSAGGTGFDLDRLRLPKNAEGRKWIRYVRISCQYSEEPNEEGDFGYNVPEVDAVADVAPVSAYEKWVEEHYTDWATAWQTNVTGAGAVAANGQLNALNFAWGLAPTDYVPTAVPFEITDFAQGERVHTITMHSPRRMDNAGGVVVQATDSLTAGWKTVVPTLTSSVKESDVYVNTLTVPADAGAFFKLVVPTE
ncbi:MAG: hypothetical protein Q4G65_06645 [bacterium]|nr:hypothetical protein [bacterium]